MLDKDGWMEEAVGMMHCLITCAYLNGVSGLHTTAIPVTCKANTDV